MSQETPRQAAGNDHVSFTVAQERRFIRPGGSYRHLVFGIKVAPASGSAERAPLSIALVLDRSGSMQGEKIVTARQAALRVLDALDERDRLAVVAFDGEVNVLQAAAPVTATVKSHLHQELAKLQARSNTALHAGWLTGCEEIARDRVSSQGTTARCFLLTDGQANAGPTDPEEIADQAASVRKLGGVSTSTFGIGPDYNEGLLGPMAVAGGGQFYHLRNSGEIVDTFEGEVGELFATAVADVRLEIDAAPGCRLELVSQYWPEQQSSDQGVSLTAHLGNLCWGEERSVVVRAGLPPHSSTSHIMLRSRLTWVAGAENFTTDWREVQFTYADNAQCDAEPRNPAIMRTIGLQHTDRAQRDAAQLNRAGELDRARGLLERVARRIRGYEGNDPVLKAARHNLERLAREAGKSIIDSMAAKELYAAALSHSRGQRDYRHP